MRKLVGRLLKSILFIVLVAVLLIVGLATTSYGTNLLFTSLYSALGDTLNIKTVDGTFFSGIRVSGVTLSNPDVILSVDQLDVKINYQSIYKLKLIIDEIRVSKLHIAIPPQKETDGAVPAIEESDDSGFRFLGYFDINDLSINDVTINQGHTAYFIKHIHAKKQRQHYKLLVESKMANIDFDAQLGRNLNINWEVAVPDFNLLYSDLYGALQSTAHIVGSRNHPSVDVKVMLKQFSYDDIAARSINLKIDTLPLNETCYVAKLLVNQLKSSAIKFNQIHIETTADIQKKSTEVKLEGDADKTINLSGNFTLPRIADIFNRNKTIKGDLRLHAAEFMKYLPNQSVVKNISGVLSANLGITGTYSRPRYKISGSLKDAGMIVSSTSTRVSNVNVMADYQDDDTVKITGNMLVGGGNATVNGLLRLDGMNAEVKLSGQNLDVADSREYKVKVSPELTLKYQEGKADLLGSVSVPFAKITPIEFDDSISIPEETSFVGKKKAEPSFYSQLSLNIDATLGKDIYIKYSGMKADITGQLQIRKEENREPTGVGDLYVSNGMYRAYGVDLKINNGRVSYTGGVITNPALNIEAAKTVKSISTSLGSSSGQNVPSFSVNNTLTVGVRVRGTAEQPKVTLFSSPGGLSQKDILSYIMFGYPASQVTGASGLGMLARAMAGDSSGGVTDRFQSMLGLSDISMTDAQYVDPNTNQTGSTSAVSVGKNLGQNLSMHYSVGLLGPVSVLNIIYKMTKNLSLKAETSTVENGADVIYSIER